MPRFLREKNGRKSFSRSSGGMPAPESATSRIRRSPRRSARTSTSPGRHGRLESVVEQIDEHAPQLLRIDPDLADLRRERSADADAGLDVAIERHHLRNQAVDRGGSELRSGHPGVARELVDQGLHLADLANDDRDALFEQLADRRILLAVFDAQAFRGQPDRRERILDLVRDPLGRLGPGGELLRPDQVGQVLEHDDLAGASPGAVAKIRNLDLEGAALAAEHEAHFGRLTRVVLCLRDEPFEP